MGLSMKRVNFFQIEIVAIEKVNVYTICDVSFGTTDEIMKHISYVHKGNLFHSFIEQEVEHDSTESTENKDFCKKKTCLHAGNGKCANNCKS